MQVQLDIYIEPNCDNCERAVMIAELVRDQLPQVDVSLIDLSSPAANPPDSVFAVPTYLLNGETCSLGNPDEARLLRQLRALIAT